MQGKITAPQFATLVTAAYLGAGIFPFPRDFVATAGPDSLYAYLLTCGVTIFGLWLWFRANRLQPDSPLSYAKKLVTPWLAFPALIFTVILHILLPAVVVSDFAFVMHSFFLIRTPTLAVEISVVAVSVYVAWFNVPGLVRTVQIVFGPAVAVSLLMAVMLVPHLTSLYAVVPSTSPRLSLILLAAYRGTCTFWGYELTATLYPMLAPGERRRAETYAYRAMLGTFAFFGIGFVVTLGVLGPQGVSLVIWPGVSALRLVNLSSFLINKLGMLVISAWGIFALTFCVARLWCLAYDVSPLFRNFSVAWYRGLLLAFSVVVLWTAQQFQSPVHLMLFAQTFMVPALLAFNFALPLTLFLGAAVGRRTGRKVRTTA